MDTKPPHIDIEETIRTRATLLFKLRNMEDGDTWREFFDLYYNFVYRHCRGSGLNHHEAEEVTLEVFQSVSAEIEKIESRPRRGSFRRYLSNKARWRVTDKLRQKGRTSHRYKENNSALEGRTDTIERVAAPEPEVDRLELEWREELYALALKRLAQKANPKHYQVFYLHQKEEWTLKKIAKELDMGRATAYVINHRLKSQLKKELDALRSEFE